MLLPVCLSLPLPPNLPLAVPLLPASVTLALMNFVEILVVLGTN